MGGRQRVRKSLETYLHKKPKPRKDEDIDSEDPEYVIKARINEDGTISNYFDKRKLRIAPRSTLQFKVGPPFKSCGRIREVICNENQEVLNLKMRQRIDRGFDHIGEEWVGYKRNYFTLVSAFEVNGWNYEDLLKYSFSTTILPLSSDNTDGISLKVLYFAVKIKATDDNDNEIQLVQHTAKRDKGPQFTPDICPLIPSKLPNHQVIREASNVRNVNKKKKFDPIFHFYKDQFKNQYDNESLCSSYPENCIKKVARFERVQFSASNSVERHFDQLRFFKLHVIMGVVVAEQDLKPFIDDCNNKTVSSLIESSDEVVLANGSKGRFLYLEKMETPALIIRGRSPSNYTPVDYLPPKSIVFDEVSLDESKENSLVINNEQPEIHSKPKLKRALLEENGQNLKVKPLPRPCRKGHQRPAKRKSKISDSKHELYERNDNWRSDINISAENDPLYSNNNDSSLIEFDECALEALLKYNTSVKPKTRKRQCVNKKMAASKNDRVLNSGSNFSSLCYEPVNENDDSNDNERIDNILFDSPPRAKGRNEILGLNERSNRKSKKQKKTKTVEVVSNENAAINLRDLEVRPTIKSVTDPGVKIGPLILSSVPTYTLTEPELLTNKETEINDSVIKSYGKLYDSELSMLQNETFFEHKLLQNASNTNDFDDFIEQPYIFEHVEEKEVSVLSIDNRGISRMATLNMQTNSYQILETKMVDMINCNDNIFRLQTATNSLTTAGNLYSDGIF